MRYVLIIIPSNRIDDEYGALFLLDVQNIARDRVDEAELREKFSLLIFWSMHDTPYVL